MFFIHNLLVYNNKVCLLRDNLILQKMKEIPDFTNVFSNLA